MKRTLLLLLVISACGTNSGTAGDDDVQPDAMPVPDPDPDPAVVNFKTQIVPIFNNSCGTGVNGCHGRDAFGANASQDCRGWLALEDAPLGASFYSGSMSGQATGCPDMSLHQRLMQLDVWQCLDTPTAYVVPGDPAASYIMHKMNGTDLCKENASSISDQMPPPNQAGATPFTLSPADKALIQQWIVEGALDN